MHDDDVTAVVHGHLAWWRDEEPEQQLFEDAYETRYWYRQTFRDGRFQSSAPGSSDEELPVKIEANRLWRFVRTHTSHLFLRAPRCSAEAPNVVSQRSRGRPKKLDELPELIEALVDEWLNRTDIQNQCTYAYQLALFSAAAFKLGVTPGRGEILDRIWLRVCPRWECVWDDRAANPQEQLYIGHLSYLTDYRAEALIGPLPDKYPRSRLPGMYTDSQRVTDGNAEQMHLERYVRVLELYDFEEEQQRFYLVDASNTDGPTVQSYGKPARMPYQWPSGQAACPLFPVVLDNTPKFPMRGIPSVRRIYRLAAEDNLLGSMIASGVRRRFAQKGFHDDQLGDDFARAWRSSADIELVKGIPGKSAEQLVSWIDMPPIDPSLDKAKAWLDQARLDTEATAPQMSGAQSKYATASEVEYQNQGAEAATNELGARMSLVLGRLAEMFLVVVAASEKSITVRRGSVSGALTREQLRMPWHLRIHDAGTTPARESARKKDWAMALPMLKDMVMLAVDPAFATVPSVARFAKRAIDEIVQRHDLDETLSSQALFLEEEAPAPPDEAPVAVPAEGVGLPMPPAVPQVPAMGVAPGPGGVASGTLTGSAPIAPPMPPQAPPVLPALPPSGQIIVDPVTGVAFDEQTGVPVDPLTGQPILPGVA